MEEEKRKGGSGGKVDIMIRIPKYSKRKLCIFFFCTPTELVGRMDRRTIEMVHDLYAITKHIFHP